MALQQIGLLVLVLVLDAIIYMAIWLVVFYGATWVEKHGPAVVKSVKEGCSKAVLRVKQFFRRTPKAKVYTIRDVSDAQWSDS